MRARYPLSLRSVGRTSVAVRMAQIIQLIATESITFGINNETKSRPTRRTSLTVLFLHIFDLEFLCLGEICPVSYNLITAGNFTRLSCFHRAGLIHVSDHLFRYNIILVDNNSTILR